MGASEREATLYFIRQGTNGPIKIGYTKNTIGLEERLGTLQTGNPILLQCIGFMNGTRQDEQTLHHRFHSQWIRGEWFYPEPILLDYISMNCATWVRPLTPSVFRRTCREESRARHAG
jgi:hypothetical protein